ncbi:DUF4890 domain-containing protein [Hanstruepera neustonica]|nr:DUF4890 domain-containing protein [Hanstruepera neustonica]
MKKIFLIALAFVSLQMTAQEKRDYERKQKMERAERMSEYTPEEMAQLQTKKMTLDLDLTEAQQKQIMAINLKNAQSRKAMMEARKARMEENKEVKAISKEEKLKLKNDMLDRKIEMKKQMKEVLNKEQYEKWEAMAKEKMSKGRHQKKQMMSRK